MVKSRLTLVIGGAVIALASSTSCLDPTEVTLDVSTNLACSDTKGATFAGGDFGVIETAAPNVTTNRCEGGSIGTLVATPSKKKDVAAAFVIVLGVDRPASECTAANRFKGCIVQRRSLHYVKHRPIRLPVEMLLVCKDVACDADSTCARNGKCVPAAITDPEACASAGCYPAGDVPSSSMPGGAEAGTETGPNAESGTDADTGVLADGAAPADGGDASSDAQSRLEAGPPVVGRLYCPPVPFGCDRGATCCWNNRDGGGGTCSPVQCPSTMLVPMKCNQRADCQANEACCGNVVFLDNGVDPPTRTLDATHCQITPSLCPGAFVCLTDQDCPAGTCDKATTLFTPTGIFGECK